MSAENDIHDPMFAPAVEVSQAPVTRSINGCLDWYLVRIGYFGSDEIDMSVKQGFDMGSSSLLHRQAKKIDGGTEVHVGGSVVGVSQGESPPATLDHRFGHFSHP